MLVVGLSHHTAPISVRERLAVSAEVQRQLVARLANLEEIAEIVLVSTCNRVEIIAAPHPDATATLATSALTAVLAEVGGSEVVPHLRAATDVAAVKHVFRVASSLDSLVVGEPQILGQLKDAIRLAEEAKTIGPRLTPVLRQAMHVAKRIRSETEIGTGQVSVPSVAVELAHRIFESFEGHAALLVGAGEMAESAAKLLARHGARLLVVNRSAQRGAELARSVGGTPLRWEELTEALVEADIVVTSTASSTPVITKSVVSAARKRRRGRSLFLIDIAVPRDVTPDVNDLENVYLYDIDDLSRVVAQSLADRATEAERAEAIVAEETSMFVTRRSQDAVKPVVVALRERMHEVLRGELERSLRGRLKHLSDDDRKGLDAMLDAAVNKLLHGPTTQLKALAMQQRSDEAVSVLAGLFSLEERAEPTTSEEKVTANDDPDAANEPASQRAVAR